MNAIKSLCVAIVLSAVGYGAYVTLTGKADAPPPPEAGAWGGAPSVELPGVHSPLASPMSAGSSAPPSETPKYLPPMAAPTDDLSSAPSSSGGLPGQSLSSMSAPSADPFPSAPLTPPPSGPPSVAHLDAGIDTSAPATPPDAHDEFSVAWGEAQTLCDQGRLGDALLMLSEWTTNTRLSPADRDRLMDRLDQLAGTVVYSRQHLLEPAYTVQPGDTLEKVAERYNVPWQLMAKINGIGDAQSIRPGDQLKVMTGPFDALVSLQDFEMTLFLYGRYAGRFRIGVGQDQSTPDGDMTVQNKVINPTYYGPGQVIGPDDPANPLGGRWIDLGNRIGIHGTNDPGSIGRAESRGCIRLSPGDINDVFDILSVGSRVTIWK